MQQSIFMTGDNIIVKQLYDYDYVDDKDGDDDD